MTDTSNMLHYECHKKVHALEVVDVGSYFHAPDGSGLSRPVKFADGSTRDLKEELFRRYLPNRGDFYVVYEDGYESFSPRKAFLEGYKLIDARTFADIKHGLRVPGMKPLATAGTNRGDGVALTSASHPGDPFKGQED